MRKVNNASEIRHALARNKRMGLGIVATKEQEEHISFLETYVFQNLGISPSDLIRNVEMQFSAEQNLRDRRQRNIEFIRGRNFGELVWDNELQKYVSQWIYNRRRNIPPLTFNVISKLVRSLVGQFRGINTGNVVSCDSKDERGQMLANMLTKVLDNVKDDNDSKTKDASNFKEMLASGSPVSKVLWDKKDVRKQEFIKFRNVNRAMISLNPGIVDYDMDNLHTICEIHDTSLNDIKGSFANGDYELGMAIESMYKKYQGDRRVQSSYSSQSFDGSQIRNNTFNMLGATNSAYRYYEIWIAASDYEGITEDPLDSPGVRVCHKWKSIEQLKKEVEEENARRIEMSEGDVDPSEIEIKFYTDFTERWYVIYMTPWGYVLDVRESPFLNGKHPYIVNPPDLNGESWGLVEEVIDAQLSMDRQIRQADSVIANASKGIWLIPDKAVPDTHSNKEYLSEFKKTDGAVIYHVEEGMEDVMPRQVSAVAANVSNEIQGLIRMYSSLIDEISGNYGAAQGRGGSDVSKTATGYALETQNASLNVSDTMENYLTFLVNRDEKILFSILEGYTKADYKSITGEEIDPEELSRYQFVIKQSKGTNSMAHRMQLEAELLQSVRDGLLPFEVFTEVATNPIWVQAKQKLEEYNKKMAEAQQIQPQ